jgi:hypothetical protein
MKLDQVNVLVNNLQHPYKTTFLVFIVLTNNTTIIIIIIFPNLSKPLLFF